MGAPLPGPSLPNRTHILLNLSSRAGAAIEATKTPPDDPLPLTDFTTLSRVYNWVAPHHPSTPQRDLFIRQIWAAWDRLDLRPRRYSLPATSSTPGEYEIPVRALTYPDVTYYPNLFVRFSVSRRAAPPPHIYLDENGDLFTLCCPSPWDPAERIYLPDLAIDAPYYLRAPLNKALHLVDGNPYNLTTSNVSFGSLSGDEGSLPPLIHRFTSAPYFRAKTEETIQYTYYWAKVPLPDGTHTVTKRTKSLEGALEDRDSLLASVGLPPPASPAPSSKTFSRRRAHCYHLSCLYDQRRPSEQPPLPSLLPATITTPIYLPPSLSVEDLLTSNPSPPPPEPPTGVFPS